MSTHYPYSTAPRRRGYAGIFSVMLLGTAALLPQAAATTGTKAAAEIAAAYSQEKSTHELSELHPGLKFILENANEGYGENIVDIVAGCIHYLEIKRQQFGSKEILEDEADREIQLAGRMVDTLVTQLQKFSASFSAREWQKDLKTLTGILLISGQQLVKAYCRYSLDAAEAVQDPFLKFQEKEPLFKMLRAARRELQKLEQDQAAALL